jgi:hypothetical protein
MAPHLGSPAIGTQTAHVTAASRPADLRCSGACTRWGIDVILDRLLESAKVRELTVLQGDPPRVIDQK